MAGIGSRLKQRVSRDVSGLDRPLKDGLSLTPDWMRVVEARHGTGTTTLEMKSLTEGGKNGDACLYATLSESAADRRRREGSPAKSPVRTATHVRDVAMRRKEHLQ